MTNTAAVSTSLTMRTELKYKFRVAVLKHVAAEKRENKDSETGDSEGASGMSFFTAVR